MLPNALRLAIVLMLAGLGSGIPTVQRESAAQNQQRARAAIDQMIAALGGKAYLSLEDAESEGRTGVFFREKSESSTEFHRYWQWPDKERMELTRQRDVVRLTVGAAMYEITFRGARVVDPQKDQDAGVYLERRHHALEIILRQWVSKPGTALFDEGPSLTENHAVERITLIAEDNDALTISVDTVTHLPVKSSFVIRNLQNGRDVVAEIYDNWKMVQGVNTPFNVLVTINGELRRQYVLKSISYNKHLPESLFAPFSPASGAKPAK